MGTEDMVMERRDEEESRTKRGQGNKGGSRRLKVDRERMIRRVGKCDHKRDDGGKM